MNNQKAIENAKNFLRNLSHITLDMTGNDEIEKYYDFSDSDKPYYIYTDGESRGCYESINGFITEKEVNKLITEQCNNRNKWDTIVILDVKKNKIVKPHI